MSHMLNDCEANSDYCPAGGRHDTICRMVRKHGYKAHKQNEKITNNTEVTGKEFAVPFVKGLDEVLQFIGNNTSVVLYM